MSNSSAAFERFFKACGVPDEMVSKYAAKFVKERIHPKLIKELGKEDLRELGIAALGDQLSIIRYIKQCDGNPPEFGSSTAKKAQQKVQQEKRVEFDSGEDEQMLVDSDSSNSRAPDRHEIYHIKMPAGNLPKTQKIMEKHSELREQGMIKRGVTGIRRAGVNLAKVSEQSRTIAKKSAVKLQDTDISSSTLLPLGTMRSDHISTKTTVVTDDSPQKSSSSVSLAKRFESLGAGGGTIRVQPTAQRALISYDDDLMIGGDQMEEEEVEEEVEEPIVMMRQKPVRVPQRVKMNVPKKMVTMAERVQIIGPNTNQRPRVQVIGQNIDDMGPNRRSRVRVIGQNQISRVQVIGGGRRRPMITMQGRKMPAMGGRAGARMGPRETSAATNRTSILDRISVTK